MLLVAGCLVQATVAPHMTNHTGTVMFLYWEAKTGKSYALDSSGTIGPRNGAIPSSSAWIRSSEFRTCCADGMYSWIYAWSK